MVQQYMCVPYLACLVQLSKCSSFVQRHSSFSGEDSPKPQASSSRRKTDDFLQRQESELSHFKDLSQHTKGIIIKKKVSIATMLQWTKVCVCSRGATILAKAVVRIGF